MKTELTQSSKSRQSRSTPVRRFNIIPLLAILAIGAIGATLVFLFPMDWVRTPNVTVSAEHSAISPNEDGNLDSVPIVYSLSTDAAVTVEVLDSNRSLVRKLIEETDQAAGQHTLVWDGLDRMGQVLPDGKYFVRVAGKATVLNAASTVQVDVDTKPPLIRLANMPEDTEVGGDDRELRIEGVTDPGATVWLNEQFHPLEVNESGGFSTDYTLQEGVNRIELVAVDEAGNQSSIVREITLRTEPPTIEVLNPPKNLWINEQMLSVQGKVSPGVELRVNQKKAEINEEGEFNVDVVLEEGENVIRVEATDNVGNVSVEERRVYLRTRPPSLSMTTVQEGMTVREPSLLVVGQTEPQTSVRLNGREVTVDSQGGFQGLVELVEGENIIRAEAVDRAGNTAVVVREVTYATGQPTNTSLPSPVRAILAATGAILAGIVMLWLASGIWQRPLSLELRAARSTLTGDLQAGGWRDPAVIIFELSRPATVTAEVWNAGNQRVDTVFQRQRRDQGEHLIVWDGLDNEGQIAPPGSYEVQVSASTMFTTVSGATRVVVEEEPPRPTWERTREQQLVDW